MDDNLLTEDEEEIVLKWREIKADPAESQMLISVSIYRSESGVEFDFIVVNHHEKIELDKMMESQTLSE